MSSPVNTTSPEGSFHVMLRVPLPTAVHEKVVELLLPFTELTGASVMTGGSPNRKKYLALFLS